MFNELYTISCYYEIPSAIFVAAAAAGVVVTDIFYCDEKSNSNSNMKT